MLINPTRFGYSFILNKFTTQYFNNFRMQPCITAFFKAKQPAADTVVVTEATNDDSSESNEVETIGEKKVTQEEKKGGGESRSLKRLADSDEDDDDWDIKTANNKKRSILSSAETTPVKSDPKVEATKELKLVESPVPAARQIFAQSPLLSVESLIKKKISSGAGALHENMGPTWFRALQPEFDKTYFKKLSDFLQQQRAAKTVYPPADKVFTWTHNHAIKDTRVVIIGQDPYHGPNQAHGLSFSVQKGVPIPKSLQNIFKELSSDVTGFKRPGHGDLTGWAKQGVLMLNACLTVNAGEANSHQGKGWETFTDAVISWISKNSSHKVVFLLWGRFAQKKSIIIDKRHKILNAAHPSPLSADNGFFGCKHFSQTNEFLSSQKLPEIDWTEL